MAPHTTNNDNEDTMTQDRRINDKPNTEKLVFTEEELIAAAQGHLHAESAAACLIEIPNTEPKMLIGVGTMETLSNWLREDTASQSQAVPSELASQITDTDSARRYVRDWHKAHFPTDRTFSRYIMAEGDRTNPLAGDFAWQLAKALEAMEHQSLFSHSAATGKVPEGWKLVPLDLTEEMRKAWTTNGNDTTDYVEGCEIAYSAMLAASPAAPLAGKAGPTKDTPESMANSNARFAIDAAIMFGREGVNKPPSEDHWLYEYWSIGQQLAKLGETSGWDNVTPVTAPLAAAVPAEEASDVEQWECLDRFEKWAAEQGHEIGPRSQWANDRNGAGFGMWVGWQGAVRKIAASKAEPAPIQQHKCATCKDTGIVYTGPLGDPPEQCDACFDQEPAPIQASALTDERIDFLWRHSVESDSSTQEFVRGFAREIETELARLSKPTAQGAAEPAAWMTEDGERVVSAATKEGQVRDGGASKSAMAPYTVPLVRHIAAQAPAGRDAQPKKWDHVAYAEDGKLHWVTGRKFDSCELYTLSQGAVSHAAEQTEGSRDAQRD